jgi:hypothetical protein
LAAEDSEAEAGLAAEGPEAGSPACTSDILGSINDTALLVPDTIAAVAGKSVFRFLPGHIPLYPEMITGSTIPATIASGFAVRKSGLLSRKPDSG